MKLIKTSLFTGVATVIKLCASFLVSKVVAMYVGPSGLAFIGQFQNFSQSIQTVANGAINTGVVKYIAEYRDDEVEKRKVLSTAILINIFCSILIGTLIFIGRNYLAVKILHDVAYSGIFSLFSCTIILFALNAFLLSVLNGERDIKKYTLVNIASSLVGLLLTWLLIVKFHLYGALLALVLSQSLVFFVSLLCVVNSKWFKIANFVAGLSKTYCIKLLKYSVMAVTSAITIPVAQIIIRNYIGGHFSWDAAGYWQGVIRISDAYLLLITTTLSVYYLPRFAEIKNKKLLLSEIMHGYKIIMPVVLLLAMAVYLLRKQVIVILFTDNFLAMLPLFKMQLLGSVFKIGAWLLGYVMLAKAMLKVFVISEIVFSISYVLLSILFMKYFGLQGVTIAFAVNYLVYWIFMIYVYRNYHIREA